MYHSNNREIKLKMERLEESIKSHFIVLKEVELKVKNRYDTIEVQRLRCTHSQLQTVLCKLEKECEQLPNLLKEIEERIQEMNMISERINIMEKKEMFDNNECSWNEEERNIYEEEVQSIMIRNEEMKEVAREIKEKAEATKKLECDIEDITNILTDLNRIVHEQGEIVDSIEENVESATNDVKRGQREMKKALQHKSTKTAITTAVVGGVVVGGPVGVIAGSTIVGTVAAIGGVITGFYSGSWLKKQATKE